MMASALSVGVFIDKLGRRKPFLSGVTVGWLMCVAVGALSLVKSSKTVNSLLIFFTCVWGKSYFLLSKTRAKTALVCAFPLQSGVAGAFSSEIPSADLKGRTISLAVGANNAINIGLGYLYPYMLNVEAWNWGLKTSWFFVGAGSPFAVACFLLLPETSRYIFRHQHCCFSELMSRRSVGEIDEMFEQKVRPWNFAKYETVLQTAIKEHQDGMRENTGELV